MRSNSASRYGVSNVFSVRQTVRLVGKLELLAAQLARTLADPDSLAHPLGLDRRGSS